MRGTGLNKKTEHRDQEVLNDVRTALKIIENKANLKDEFVEYQPDDLEGLLREQRRSRQTRLKFDKNPSIERFEKFEKARQYKLENMRSE